MLTRAWPSFGRRHANVFSSIIQIILKCQTILGRTFKVHYGINIFVTLFLNFGLYCSTQALHS